MKAWYLIDKNIKGLHQLPGSSPMMSDIWYSWEILELVNTLDKSPFIEQLWSREAAATIVKEWTLTQIILFQGAKALNWQDKGSKFVTPKEQKRMPKLKKGKRKSPFPLGRGNYLQHVIRGLSEGGSDELC